MIEPPGTFGPYVLKGVLGHGAFSTVRLAYNETTDQYFACKIIARQRLMLHNLEERLENEIRINQQLHHPGVVALYDLYKDDSFYYIIMEFCPNGELFSHVVDKGRLDEFEAKIFIRQILFSLKYVHSLGICHRDLKPENLLLDQSGHVKISDFGLSRFVGPNSMVSTPCGSPCYASPECVSGKPYDGCKSDIWSCGVISYAILTGQLPWTKRNQQQLFEQIKRGEYSIPMFLSENCRSFISGLMTVDGDRRLTIEAAFYHPWFNDSPVPTLSMYDIIPPELAPIPPSLRALDLFFGKDDDSDAEDDVIEAPTSIPFGGSPGVSPYLNIGPTRSQILDDLKKTVNILKPLAFRKRLVSRPNCY